MRNRQGLPNPAKSERSAIPGFALDKPCPRNAFQQAHSVQSQHRKVAVSGGYLESFTLAWCAFIRRKAGCGNDLQSKPRAAGIANSAISAISLPKLAPQGGGNGRPLRLIDVRRGWKHRCNVTSPDPSPGI
jgi:hypothetical protein